MVRFGLSELLLIDASLDEETTVERIAISFLIDMNALFEKFVVHLFQERIKTEKLNLEEQIIKYVDTTSNELRLKLDVLISYNKKPIIIQDTKYKQFEGQSRNLPRCNYTISKQYGVQNCCLIYAAETKEPHHYQLYHGIKLNISSFNLQASNIYEFENKCINFISSINSLLQRLTEKEES